MQSLMAALLSTMCLPGHTMLDVVAMHLVYPQVSVASCRGADKWPAMLLLLCASTQKLETIVHLSCALLTDQLCCIMWLSLCRCSLTAWNDRCVCAGQAGRESHRRGNSGVC